MSCSEWAASSPPPFDLHGPLPGPGITVLEASAGTGKTYTLTSLVARFIAAGVPPSDILAVTFTRMATGELRDRIRERLVAAHSELAGTDDPVATRVADAVADFDAMTIATTHGFCQTVLRELGSAGGTALDATLLEDPGDLLGEVVDDLYLRWTEGPRPMLPFPVAAAREAALIAARNPDIRVVPHEGTDASGLLGRLAIGARREVERRLLEANLLTYDQLLYRLAGTLADPERGRLACERLQARYGVVLVDEFQDTDPSQWQVLQRAFGNGHTTLVLIGDPKQAIYGFRGADVYSYLDAAGSCSKQYTLSESWRSDQPLLDATDALFSPLQFGHEGIPYRTVKAEPGRSGAGLRDHPHPEPLRFRVVPDRQAGIRITAKGQLQKGSLLEWLAADLADDVAQLLCSEAQVLGPGGAPRPVVPGDIGVLTRTNRQALLVRDALRRAGVPSVVAGLDTVFASTAARHWLRLLDALQEPSSRSRLVAAAMTHFIGMSAEEVATAEEHVWEATHDRVYRWVQVLTDHGVAALYRAITAEERLPGRLLSSEGGERLLTDLGHVAQLLHAEAAAGQLAAPALRAWLAARIASASREQEEAEERSRRLESDAEAVQVLTIHRAKGLEFGVVYCPFLWDGSRPESRSGPVVFHDPDAGDIRTLEVGCPSADSAARRRYDGHAALGRAERRGEELRLLYVALTRARHQVVVWWAAAKDSRMSPLARLLLCRDDITGEVRDVPAGEPSSRMVIRALEAVAGRAPGLVAIEVPGAVPPSGLAADSLPSSVTVPELTAARFERDLDRRWRRASYTSVTSGAHDVDRGLGVASEPEHPGLQDEPTGPDGGAVGGPVVAAAAIGGVPGGPVVGLSHPGRFAELPGGADFGTLVHRILERTDFAADDLDASLAAAAAAVAGDVPRGVDPEGLRSALAAAIDTPLGPMVGRLALRQIPRADRLDELSFELPIAGGDVPVGDVLIADIASLIAAHPTPPILDGYPRRLAGSPVVPDLRGYLTGSIDLAFRTVPASVAGSSVAGSDATGPPRWYIVDYKTNWLAPPGEDLTVGHYQPDALEEEMQLRHYPLQALFYAVALHRYLRWRQPRYRPDTHLGGVLYLFLRGMAGADTPVVDGHPCGVFSWKPPAELIVSLSDLFGEGRARR